ncbi:helix-turn-helix domain-containing protein [Pseudomonas vancouverensis]|uniref:helix-turn-helix domain-containing protein n=1 Tax=Pseudomonas vancouverensis TaxID=95300 RepID=UPI003D0189B2
MLIESLRATTFPGARTGERVLYVRVGESPVHLVSLQCVSTVCLPTGWEGLVAASGSFTLSGALQFLPIAQTPLVKLQVFIDMGNEPAEHPSVQAPWATLAVKHSAVRCERALERWYIEQAMAEAPGYRAFASQLRHGENYGLIRFLLEQGTRSEKLSALAQRYGVSVSHFRRLCRQALGTATKPALRGWRTARALLDMSLQDRTLTDIALEFGFASSSHFSKEIRELVGFTPSSLADITYLQGK